MKHAIVGAGGVGGLMAVALVNIGEDVTVVLRPETLASYPEKIELTSPLGNFQIPVRRAAAIDSHFDVLWLSTKATQLDAAIDTISSSAGRNHFDLLVPLLNGVDHIRQLRSLYGEDRVVPATIAVESERIAPGHIVHRSQFVRLTVSSKGKGKLAGVLDELIRFGFTCAFADDEVSMMWRKLVFLAPIALTSSAAAMTTGGLMQDPIWMDRLRVAVRETGAVAAAEGAHVDVDATLKIIESLPPDMKSSMQKDVEAGRKPELDAIGGPIVRGGKKHGIPTSATEQLIAMVLGRMHR